jgi:hypothetical protein
MGKGTWADVAMAAVFLLLPVGGSYFKAAKKAANVADGTTDVARAGTEAGDLAAGTKKIAQADNVGDAGAKGGVYRLKDPDTGQVIRTGRSGNLDVRKVQHARDKALKDYDFEVVFRTDDRNQQRGLEQLVHEAYDPPLDKINGIRLNNPNRDLYLRAADDFIAKYGVSK